MSEQAEVSDSKNVRRLAASQSFTAPQTKLLKTIMETIAMGGDTRVFRHNKEFTNLYSKSVSMQHRVDQVSAERAKNS